MLVLQKTFSWYRYWYCYRKRAFLGINIDIAIAKDPLLVSILILLLQNTLCWYRYWYCYCITPSSVIDINIAIAYYLSLVLILLLLLINGLQTIESQKISKKSLLLSPAWDQLTRTCTTEKSRASFKYDVHEFWDRRDEAKCFRVQHPLKSRKFSAFCPLGSGLFIP